MKKQIFPLQRNRAKLKNAYYEHLGNGYYRDMITGKILDKRIKQLFENKNNRIIRLK